MLRVAVLACCGVYVVCCLAAVTFVDDMRDFPESSRTVMKVVLLLFAAGALLLAVALSQGRAWASVTAVVIGAVGVALFLPARLMWKGDPEWQDASQAAATVVLLGVIGGAALVLAGATAALAEWRAARRDGTKVG